LFKWQRMYRLMDIVGSTIIISVTGVGWIFSEAERAE
jgi:hypothetical protein